MTAERLKRWWPAIAIPALVVISYFPVILHGGFIWDDPDYVTQNTTLRDLQGLHSIWFHPQSIPQYYPLVHSTFWIEYQLWQLNPLGYHIDNILLHALAAILLWRVLVRLNLPAAWLAAAIFAVHPVQVESVAWITERKNVLSAVFYLASLGAYLRFARDDLRATPRNWRMYDASLAFFVMALLSKSVTCSLPAAILLLVFWKRGKITWRDIGPTIPFFIIGLGMAWVTATLERTHVGAMGPEWNFSAEARCLIAARAIWFYVVKLVWPYPLVFVYPRWQAMNLSARPELMLFPIAAVGVLAALWMLRQRIGRGPLTAALFFVGALTPALGFVNVYPMRYTFVADHYQYIACIGLMLPVAVILQRWAQDWAALVLLPLIALSWQRGYVYHDALTLWLDTRDENPNAWVVWVNLGDEYTARGDFQDAKVCYERLLELLPADSMSHWKWGTVLEHENDLAGAKEEYLIAIKLDPHAAMPRQNMGIILLTEGKSQEALEYFRAGMDLDPSDARSHYNYALALEKTGDDDGARSEYMAATGIDPHYADAQFNLGNLLLVHDHRPDLALGHLAQAVSDLPLMYNFHFDYASALAGVGRMDDARAECRTTLRLKPGFAPARQLLIQLGG